MAEPGILLAAPLFEEAVPNKQRRDLKVLTSRITLLLLSMPLAFVALQGALYCTNWQYLATRETATTFSALQPLSAASSRFGSLQVAASPRAHDMRVRGVAERNTEAEAPQTRRSALFSSAALLSTLAARHAGASVTSCPSGANNCWSTASTDKTKMAPWKWPASMSRDSAMGELKAVLESYPQAGQNDADKGGYSIVVDDLASKGYMRLEYKSGIGNFAKFFNGGKPFVDDLELSVEDGFVGVRSSSRVGDSDFGVNAKRLNFLSAALRGKGWDAPEIKT